MPVRIRILSGSRQGEILDLGQQIIHIGEFPHDEVAFDLASDPGIAGRRATLQNIGGRWQIHSTGTKPVFVNQTEVTDTAELHDRDVVRLSYDGPDLSFDLIEDPMPLAVEEPLAVEKVIEPKWRFPHFVIPAFALASLLSLLALGFLASKRGLTTEVVASPPEFQPFGALRCKEGESFFWKPTLRHSHASDRFSLGKDAPDGMTIDPKTGTIRWATDEQDGPGDVVCQITVTRKVDKQTLSDAATMELQVQEVNRSPDAEAIATQEINLQFSNQLRFSLPASDPDIPRQKLTYQLKPEAPDGVSLDRLTGLLTWSPDPGLGDREVIIPYRVTDDGEDPKSVDAVVRVKIASPDPWSIVEHKIRESLYLLVVKSNTAPLFLPIGTACAIDDHLLLTSASVASALHDAIQRGWSTLAVDTTHFDLSDLVGLEIVDSRSHSIYVKGNSIEEARTRGLQQVYFDLAILTTAEPTKKVCRLGDVESSVKNDQVVACFGYEIFGGSLTRFDDPQPVFSKTKILEVISPTNGLLSKGRQPLLLQLVGELSHQPFGGVIVNENAEVLGIYAFTGDVPDDSKSPPVHYAPETVHVQAYLSGQGRDLWITPSIRPTDSEQP